MASGAIVIAFRLGFGWLLALGLLWIGFTVWAGYRFFDWPCPRCGKPFVLDLPNESAPGAKRCLHCGLPLGAGRDPGEVPEWVREEKEKEEEEEERKERAG